MKESRIPYDKRTLTDQARAYLERLIESKLDGGYVHDRYDLSLTETMESFRFGAFYMLDQMRNMLYDRDAKPTPLAQYCELSRFVSQMSTDIGIHRKGKLFMMMDEAERYEMLSKYLNDCLYDIDEQRLIELKEVDSDE